MSSQRARDFALAGWGFDERATDSPTIAAAATVASAELLRDILIQLRMITSLMSSLGDDGIHTVVREARREAVEKQRKRLARARKLRAAKKAARSRKARP